NSVGGRMVGLRVVYTVFTTSIVEREASAEREHWPQVHETNVGRRTVDANARELILEEGGVKVDIVGRQDSPMKSSNQFTSDVAERRGIHDVLVPDSMDLR